MTTVININKDFFMFISLQVLGYVMFMTVSCQSYAHPFK